MHTGTLRSKAHNSPRTLAGDPCPRAGAALVCGIDTHLLRDSEPGRGAARGVRTDHDEGFPGVDPQHHRAVVVGELIRGDREGRRGGLPCVELEAHPVCELEQRPGHIGNDIANVEFARLRGRGVFPSW